MVFAEWLYRTRHAPLFNRFMQGISAGYNGQHIIALRAQRSTVVQPDPQSAQHVVKNVGGAEKWNGLRSAIRNSGPVALVVQDSNSGVVVKIGLAFSYVGKQVFLYSPTEPGVTDVLTYDTATQSFGSFGGPSEFGFMGLGSLAHRESFENILRDAEANFHNSADAVLDLGGVADGDIILHNKLHIDGFVHSGSRLIERVWALNDSYPNVSGHVEVEPGSGGKLIMDIPLVNGDNYIRFNTFATTTNGDLLNIPNNLSNLLLRVTGEFTEPEPPKDRFRIELTWDTQGESPGELNLVVYESEPGASGTLPDIPGFLHNGYYGDSTSPYSSDLLAAELGSGGPEIFRIQDDVAYAPQGIWWRVHRADYNGDGADPKPINWVAKIWWGVSDTEPTIVDDTIFGADSNHEPGMNYPDNDSSNAWSPWFTFGL
jgi:hypothetical protein